MSEFLYISRDQLAGLLDDLAQTQMLIAPQDTEGVLLYRPVRNSQDILWDFTRPLLSVKEAFFPPTERLLLIEKNGVEVKLTETLPQVKQVVFGVRPCEARGMKALDALFIETEPVDTYYARRRANTTLIGLACQEMGASCFCTSVGGAPNDTTGMDLMLTQVDGGYAVQVVTQKGSSLLEERSIQARRVEPPQYAPQNVQATITCPASDALPPRFNQPYWEALSERCLSCRLCAYVCPTCRCFDVRDEVISPDNGHDTYERVRCWDSCAGVAYRRIAGGHNPRAAKGERLRNRFYCKFHYYPRQYGPSACTGCGRCIDVCPVNIDITEVMGYLVEESA